jgi:hypothetical protein
MSNKFPVYLAKVEISPSEDRKFVKESYPYSQRIWGTPYGRFTFKLRKAYFSKPNCNLECPPGKDFYCCKKFGCRSHCGFFEWDEVSFFSEVEKDKILSLWNNGTGFYRKNGCVLPRNLRSLTCLEWSCGHSKTKE